ncbi:hypothetical protein BDN70DRAFT_883694 [Pholiota conissans]|uniref:Protein kinase domain-containing protein n=1 Tax=Pholiota conissans TaxID=109636 RepID=A0A9P5YUM5_9AGAR|nr:hypothetical protein BDN70DRAFT_883694 [Pholiota conissans]
MAPSTDATTTQRYKISSGERFWVDLQPFLLSRGYRLRPRYDPNWKPSWIADDGKSICDAVVCEDSIVIEGSLLDGIRIEDNQKVVFKKVATKRHELPIAVHLSSPALRNDPRNHAVPILDVIPIPADDDWALLVMPMLLEFQKLPFRRLGEFCEAALQYLQALEFMHEHNIVHRDVCMSNLAMDISKVVPKGSHFGYWRTHDGVDPLRFEWNERWSVRPVQYYVIDFGISLQLPGKDVLTIGEWGRDRTVPEMSNTEWYDPFKVDVYQLGNVFMQMIETYDGLKVFRKLAMQMTSKNPKDRPTAAEAVRLFEKVVSKLSHRAQSRRIWRDTGYYSSGKFIDRFRVRFRGWNPTVL